MSTTTADPGVFHLESVVNIGHDLRDNPSADFLTQLRERFPTEREFDAMLTRKMQRRPQPRRLVSGLDELTASLNAFLQDHLPGSFSVSNVHWLAGGASKIQVAFALEWDDPQVGRTVTEMVVRMEPQESLNATSRMREFQLLRAFEGTLPVPRVFWVDADGHWFPEPALIYAYATGVSAPSEGERQTTGVGNKFGAALRPILAQQFIEHLAAIHTFDYRKADLDSFDIPESGTPQTALWQLNRARRVWDEDRGEDLPLLEVAANWLDRNAPLLDQPSIVHGDYRSGNFLFDEPTGQITAWLDWERGHIGDRHRDLAWITLPQFGQYADDGRLLVSGLVPLDEFLEAYERASGLSVDKKRLHYYKILNSFQLIVSSMGSAYRVSRIGKSHQDVLLTSLEGSAYIMAEEIRAALVEEEN